MRILNRSFHQIRNQSENDDIPEKPEKLQPMAVQYHCHVIQTETCDNDIALPLIEVVIPWYRQEHQIQLLKVTINSLIAQVSAYTPSSRFYKYVSKKPFEK